VAHAAGAPTCTASIVYAAVALFVVVRVLDDFVFTPLTVGRSLRLHPLATVLMIFVGGTVAGSHPC